jgi:hypothetical protein
MGSPPPSLPGIPGSEPPPPGPRSSRPWVALIIAVLLAIVLTLSSLGFLINTVGPHDLRTGASRFEEGVGTVISLLLLILCCRWVVHVEHRLRRHQPVAHAFQAQHTTVVASGVPVPRRRRGRRRPYGPVGTSVVLALYVGVVIGCVAGAVVCHSQAARSNFVQSHGTPANATADSVVNTESCSRSGCDYTAAIVVTLTPPVDGRRTTTAHFPGFSDVFDGERLQVLVDPRQPGYAELPGATFSNAWAWIILSIIALFFAGLGALQVRTLHRLLVHRREHSAALASGLPSAS